MGRMGGFYFLFFKQFYYILFILIRPHQFIAYSSDLPRLFLKNFNYNIIKKNLIHLLVQNDPRENFRLLYAFFCNALEKIPNKIVRLPIIFPCFTLFFSHWKWYKNKFPILKKIISLIFYMYSCQMLKMDQHMPRLDWFLLLVDLVISGTYIITLS